MVSAVQRSFTEKRVSVKSDFHLKVQAARQRVGREPGNFTSRPTNFTGRKDIL